MIQIPYTHYVYAVSLINTFRLPRRPGILQIITTRAVESRLGTKGVLLHLAGPPKAGQAANIAAEKGEVVGGKKNNQIYPLCNFLLKNNYIHINNKFIKVITCYTPESPVLQFCYFYWCFCNRNTEA